MDDLELVLVQIKREIEKWHRSRDNSKRRDAKAYRAIEAIIDERRV